MIDSRDLRSRMKASSLEASLPAPSLDPDWRRAFTHAHHRPQLGRRRLHWPDGDTMSYLAECMHTLTDRTSSQWLRHHHHHYGETDEEEEDECIFFIRERMSN